ncbi:FUSC family protein [Micromonospora sp. NPDC004540]|uniref:FUSC family protein n=1 Tax=Micromonospora sp. NPDC004540 TaxID=3154457 RepID=UPI0033B31993
MTAVVAVARRHAREAYERLRRYFIVALQAGLAAGLSWYVANTLLHNPQPLFAPAAAVGTIAAAIGNRVRRTAELLAGVIVGVLAGDLIIQVIGNGPVQTGLVVALAISAAVVFRGSGAVMVPADLPAAIETFGQSLRLLHRDFLAGRTPEIARSRALHAAEAARRARAQKLGFSGTIVASQLFIVVGELLPASGLTKPEADRMAGV